ncbi:uracil-DNA glycosylase [Candidatus Pelagibacter bacterium]|jgi:uracil-DNA glycosylase|nr:uracil-DNA glycosylase [Candidatus Pelagibacter bacterium]
MSKKAINQNPNYNEEFLNSIGINFVFNEKPINRLKNDNINLKTQKKDAQINKKDELDKLKIEISAIEDCALKNNSNKIILGDGNINSPIMIIGEAPGAEEEETGKPFMGQTGDLLKKMLIAINIEKENIYSSYAVNFRPPEDRKPSSNEIKRYSKFLQKHVSIIDPEIIILMGSSAMQSITGLNNKISVERGKWRDIIIKNTNYKIIITFNPSYLLRAPENKKHSWEDLKKIKQKITDLHLKI